MFITYQSTFTDREEETHTQHMDAHTNVCTVLCTHTYFLCNRQYVSLTHTIVGEISIAPTVSIQRIYSETYRTREKKQKAVVKNRKRKAMCLVKRQIEQVQILHTKRPNRKARVKHMEAFV